MNIITNKPINIYGTAILPRKPEHNRRSGVFLCFVLVFKNYTIPQLYHCTLISGDIPLQKKCPLTGFVVVLL